MRDEERDRAVDEHLAALDAELARLRRLGEAVDARRDTNAAELRALAERIERAAKRTGRP